MRLNDVYHHNMTSICRGEDYDLGIWPHVPRALVSRAIKMFGTGLDPFINCLSTGLGHLINPAAIFIAMIGPILIIA